MKSQTGVRLIQVKTNRDASPLERRAIQLFDGLPGNATKELWIFLDYAGANGRDRPNKSRFPRVPPGCGRPSFR